MKFATLLYIKNNKGEYLLLERKKAPNKGLLSPPGGKLMIEQAESPHSCAVREASEECGIISSLKDWKLIGIVTEKEYPAIGNIMVFLFEYQKIFDTLPPEFDEGKFCFVSPGEIQSANIPSTDKLFIWKFVLENNDRPFSIYLDCTKVPFKCVVEHE